MKYVRKQLVLYILLFLLIKLVLFTQPVVAQDTIYIRSDGSIEGTTSIGKEDNVYTLLNDISTKGSALYGVKIETDNIIFDGAGHTLLGTTNQVGIFTERKSNITIKNMIITDFGTAMHFKGCTNITIKANTIKNNNNALQLHYLFNSKIYENTIANNSQKALFFIDGEQNHIYKNNLINNLLQFEGIMAFPIWDDGFVGNYWDEYKGIDANGDGIGDSPYIIDENHQDNFQ